jgi:hypothetical protein
MAQQNVEVRIVGKDEASPVFTRVGGALERMKISVESNRGALGKLDNALKNSATQMLGLTGTAGRLSQALLAFGPAGIVGGLAVAGISLFVNQLSKQKEETNETTSAVQKYLDTAGKVLVAQKELAGDTLGAKQTEIVVGYQKLNEELKAYLTSMKNVQLNEKALDKDRTIAAKTMIQMAEQTYQALRGQAQRTANQIAILQELISDPVKRGSTNILVLQAQLKSAQKDLAKFNNQILVEGEKIQGFRLLDLQLQQEQKNVTENTAKSTIKSIDDIIKEYTQLRNLQAGNVELSERQNNRLIQIGNQATAAVKNNNVALEDRAKWLTVTLDITKRIEDAQKKYVDTLVTEYSQLRQLQDAGFTLSVEQGRQLSAISREATQAFADTTKSLEERLRWSATANDVINRYIQSIQDANTKLEAFQEESRNRISADIETWAKGITDEVDKLKEVSAMDILRGIPTGGDTERDAQRRRNEQAQEEQERVNRLQLIAASAYAVADGFDVMTDAVMNGDNAFKALERGARSAIRGIMRAFAQEQIARGIGAVGSALSQTALGNFPAAGAFYKSAAKHFAAAAAAGIAGGVVGGGGSNRGGGGGFSESNLGNTGRGQSPIFITITGGGLLDMNNPETARAFTNAINVATNRRTIITRR